MSRGSIDFNRPTTKVGDKALNDGDGEEEGFRFPCVEGCASMVKVKKASIGWAVLLLESGTSSWYKGSWCCCCKYYY